MINYKNNKMGIFDLFGRSNSAKDENHVFKNTLEFLSKDNTELFEFVKTIVDNSKKGVKIDQDELEKLTQILVMKLVMESSLSKKIRKNDPSSKELAIQVYALTDLYAPVKYLSDILDEYEDNKFNKWDEIEMYYSIYLFIYDTITK